MKDTQYMMEALRLAEKGMSYVAPNPLVGAVIVKNDVIIGTGYHQRYGGAHAEIEAIRAAGRNTQGSTMYVTLEPCATRWKGKKHPPCTDAILAAGIREVHIAHKDPNKKVHGKGIELLRKNGVTVTEGLCKQDAMLMNQAYITNTYFKKNFIHLKIAMSLDGVMSLNNGDSKWISGSEARKEVHSLRARYQSVMVGAATVRKDNPLLTVRHVEGPNPARIILDHNASTPIDAHIVETACETKTVLFISESSIKAQFKKIEMLTRASVECIEIPLHYGRSLKSFLAHSVERLYEMGITSVLLEGGRRVAKACLELGLWDRLSVYISPMILGTGVSVFPEMEEPIISMKDAQRYLTRWMPRDDGMHVECYNPTCLVDL